MRKCIVAVLLLSGLAVAQEFPRYELITGFSYGSMDTSAASHAYAQGWLGGFAANLSRSVGLEAQAAAHYTDTSFFVQSKQFALSPRTYSFLAGPRLEHRGRRMTPFVHGLFGILRTNDYSEATLSAQGNYVTVPYQSAFGAAAGGGFDYAIGRHVALRTQVDYLFGRVNYTAGTAGNLQTLAALVFTFGGEDTLDAQRSELRKKMTRLAKAQAETPAASPARPSELAAATKAAIAMKPGEQWAAQPAAEPATIAPAPVAASVAPPSPASPVTPPHAIVATLNAPIAGTLPLQLATPVHVAAMPVAALQPAIAEAPAVHPVTATPASAASKDVVIGRETVYAAISNPPDGNQGMSLGEIARRYRERKKRELASNQ